MLWPLLLRLLLLRWSSGLLLSPLSPTRRLALTHLHLAAPTSVTTEYLLLQNMGRWTLPLLGLASLLNAGLYFPLFMGADQASDGPLKQSPLAEAIAIPAVVYLSVSAAAVLVPVLLDVVLDMAWVGVGPASLELVFLILWSFAISLARVIFLDTPYAVKFYGISQMSLFWVYVCVTFFTLQRVCSKVFTPARVLIALSLTYLYSILELYFFAVDDDHGIRMAVLVAKYGGFSYVMLLHLSFYIILFLEWRTAKTPLTQWFGLLSADVLISIIVSALYVFALLVYFSASVVFIKDTGIRNISSEFEYFFISGSILTSVLITIIPPKTCESSSK